MFAQRNFSALGSMSPLLGARSDTPFPAEFRELATEITSATDADDLREAMDYALEDERYTKFIVAQNANAAALKKDGTAPLHDFGAALRFAFGEAAAIESDFIGRTMKTMLEAGARYSAANPQDATVTVSMSQPFARMGAAARNPIEFMRLQLKIARMQLAVFIGIAAHGYEYSSWVKRELIAYAVDGVQSVWGVFSSVPGFLLDEEKCPPAQRLDLQRMAQRQALEELAYGHLLKTPTASDEPIRLVPGQARVDD